ncbi:MAG TPA: radical SAM protein, partial [Casimicrobiaceae bacterium]|nr:radical SAM protein [Casimicrobiaceae bacterium]
WELFELLADEGVSLKLETDASRIDDDAADRLARLGVQCIQISVDGATASTHAIVRPGSSFSTATAAIRRLVQRGCPPELVFVPTRLNIAELIPAYDLALELGCRTFVTGPLMRIGRAARAWDRIACSESEWSEAASALAEHAKSQGGVMRLSVYPWDIVTEMETRLQSPQAMLLVVPNGKVKLLNALPFAPADLRRDSIEQAWDAYRAAWQAPVVAQFIGRCRTQPELLLHANETWEMNQGVEQRG